MAGPYSEDAAGIGGGRFGDGGVIAISEGRVTAEGGRDAAGIGGGAAGSVTSIDISGGLIDASSEYRAAAVGGGYSGKCGAVRIAGGTVRARADIAIPPSSTGRASADIGIGYSGGTNQCSVTIAGGSVHDAGRGIVWPNPTDGSARVWRVDVGGLPENAPVQVAFLYSTAGTAYGTDGIYADPKNPETLVKEITAPTAEALEKSIREWQTHCVGASRAGANGAGAKLEYALRCAQKGVEVLISHAKYPIAKIRSGQARRTRICIE